MQTTQQTQASEDSSCIERLSDSEFIALTRTFSELPSIEEKVAFITSNSETGEGIFEPVVRLIKGRVNSYGFDPEFHEISIITLALHTQLRDKAFDEFNKELQGRLHACRYSREVVNLLEAEVRRFKERIIEATFPVHEARDLRLGYQFEVQKRTDVYQHPNVNLFVNIETNKVFYETVSRCSLGAAMYRFEMHLEELLERAKKNVFDKQVSGSHPSNDLPPTNNENNNKSKVATLPLKDLKEADFIEPALLEKFFNMEQRLEQRKKKWLNREDMIDCAGFLQALFLNSYFTWTKPGRRSSVNNELVRRFALWRYGLDLKVQLLPQKRGERDKKCKYFLDLPMW